MALLALKDYEPESNDMIRSFIQGGRVCTGDDKCRNSECIECGERDCPHGEPLHYHHDGCPACSFDENHTRQRL